MLSTAYQAPDGDPYDYGQVKDILCWQIFGSIDTTILNENEGLDVYINIFATVKGVVQDFTPNQHFDSDTDVVHIVYAIKRKSDPEC